MSIATPVVVREVAFDEALDGPTWYRGGLLFSRPAKKEIHRYDPRTGHVTLFRHSTAGNIGLVVAPDGRLFGAQATSRRVVWYADGGETYLLNAMLHGTRHNDPQQLAIDRKGRIWFSDAWTSESTGGPVGWPPLPHQSVLRLTRVAETDDGIGEWMLERLTTDTDSPRGVGLPPDGSVLFVVDRGDGADRPPTLRRYPVSEAGLGGATVVREYPRTEVEGPAGPTGLCVGADGRVFVAVGDSTTHDSGAIEVFAPDGGSVQAVPITDGRPSNCAFGEDGRTLYITTTNGRLLQAEV